MDKFGAKMINKTIRLADLMDIVILGDAEYMAKVYFILYTNPEYMAKEWKLLRNFSRVHFVAGSVLSRWNCQLKSWELREVCIKYVNMEKWRVSKMILNKSELIPYCLIA